MRKIFGFGETVFDIIFKAGEPVAARPGGSVLNSFVSLGRLGWKPVFISEYGQDAVGDLIEKFLAGNGVSTEFVSRYEKGQSALALAFLDDNHDAHFSFYRDFPEERLQNLPEGIRRDDLVMFGSIYASSAPVRDSVVRFLEAARSAGGLILYDPNFREAHLKELEELRPRIIENLASADIIRGSDEDFRLIFGISDPMHVADRFLTGSDILIYTRNRESVLLFTGGTCLEIPVDKIDPVSTIGAGDSFNAGIAHYILSRGIPRDGLPDLTREELMEMVSTGNYFASHVCRSYDNYISREFASGIQS